MTDDPQLPALPAELAGMLARAESIDDTRRDALADVLAATPLVTGGVRAALLRRRREAARLLATAGLGAALMSALPPVPAAAAPPPPPLPAPTRSMATHQAGPALPASMSNPDIDASGDGIDAAEAAAQLAALLGFNPPGVSVADLRRFIEASFVVAANEPYKQSDPLDDPLDRGMPIPVVGQRAIDEGLGRIDAALTDVQTVAQLPVSKGEPSRLEEMAFDALESGDVGSFRRFYLQAVADTGSDVPVDDRSMLMAVSAALGNFDEVRRQGWLDRIAAFEAGEDAPACDPSTGDTAVFWYASSITSNSSVDASLAPRVLWRANLLEAFLDRALAAESARRELARRAIDSPELPAVVAPDGRPVRISRGPQRDSGPASYHL